MENILMTFVVVSNMQSNETLPQLPYSTCKDVAERVATNLVEENDELGCIFIKKK